METKKNLENEEFSKKKELLSDKELSEVAGGGRRPPYGDTCKDACKLLKIEEYGKCVEKCNFEEKRTFVG